MAGPKVTFGTSRTVSCTLTLSLLSSNESTLTFDCKVCQKYQVGDNCCIIAVKSSFRFDLFEDDWIDMQNAVGKQSNKDSIWARTSEGIWTAFYKVPFGAHDKLPANVLQHWFAIITKALPSVPQIAYSSDISFFWNKGDQTNEMIVGKKPRR